MLSRSYLHLNNIVKKDNLKLTLRLQHKTAKQEKDVSKVAPDVINYIDNTPEYRNIKDKLPRYLLRKYKTPENMYLINQNTAKDITDAIKKFLGNDCPIVEINPGLGFLSEQLLQNQTSHIYMYETSNHFTPYLKELQQKFPGRVTYKVADFFGMWKLAFQDKIDNGNRLQELLGDLYTADDDSIVKIIGSTPGLTFVKHLINNIVFHNSRINLGRPDLYITMPAYHYEFLTDNEVQLSKYKSLPALFQLLFTHKIIRTVPSVHFLPWTHLPNTKKATMMDEYSLYLVNITQRQKLPCPAEYLPLLWYFFKPHMFSKTTRVIPMLEQWIPGCGVWLITGQDPPDTNKELAPGKDDAELPHMTIFTEFGDLNLKQKITVFKRFISWPEFEQCQFRVTMENNLPKFVTQLDNDDDKDNISHIDEIDQSDNENET